MNATELRAGLKRSNTSQAQFARLVGVSDRTVRFWLKGTHRIPATIGLVARMILTLREDGITNMAKQVEETDT
jgi:DNA-binding transcriptional regulator YiaG